MLTLEKLKLTEENSYGLRVGADLDPLDTFVQNAPQWIQEARQELLGGFSYRGFDVKAIALAHMSDGTLRLYKAQNIKLAESVPKTCSEMFVLDQAASEGAVAIIGMVVLGTTDEQLISDVTFLATPTLHSCEPCRENYIRKYMDRGLIKPNMPLITTGINVGEDLLEFHTAGQMLDRYTDPIRKYKEFWPEPVRDPYFVNWLGRRVLFAEMTSGQPTHPEVPPDISPIEVARMVITGMPSARLVA